MTVVVLDYSGSTVTTYGVSKKQLEELRKSKDLKDYDESELIESFIDNKGHHLSNCFWMSGENITFIDER